MATISKDIVKAQSFYNSNTYLKSVVDAYNGSSYAFKVVNGRCMKLAIAFYSSAVKKVGKDKDILIPTSKLTDVQPASTNGNVVTFKNSQGKLDCGFLVVEKRIMQIVYNPQTKKYEKDILDFSNVPSKSLDDLVIQMNDWVNA